VDVVVVAVAAVVAAGRLLDIVGLDDMPARAYPLENALLGIHRPRVGPGLRMWS